MTNPPPYPGNQPYGQMPGYQSQGSRLPRPAVPGTVTGAFALYVLAALVSVVSAILLTTESGREEVRRAVREAQASSGMNPADFDAAVSLAIGIGIGFVVLFIALYLFFAFMMRAGRNWARIVLTVLSGLSIAGGLSGTAAAGGMTWANWVSLVFSVLAIVLMFLTPSNEYFQRSKQYRAQQQLLG